MQRLCVGVAYVNIINYGIDESMLGEFIHTIVKFLDVDSHIVSWMALIFNVESLVLYLLDNLH